MFLLLFVSLVTGNSIALQRQYLDDSVDACKLVGAVPHFACTFLTSVAQKAFHAAVAQTDSAPIRAEFEDLWRRFKDTPMGPFLAPAYARLPVSMESPDKLMALALAICDEVRVFMYSHQRLNIMLHAFEKFPTSGLALPHFHFSHLLGARWEVALELLEPLNPQPVVAEIGVFRGFFSEFLLATHPALTLVGVDPYFGLDGTFPPPEKAEDLVDPEEIYQIAQTKYDGFPGRAKLLRMGSEEAAELIQDKSLDLVFIDGCHEVECIAADLQLWTRKVRTGGIVMGHDYSERWPGVMVVLNEWRAGQDLHLGSDLVWWFYQTE